MNKWQAVDKAPYATRVLAWLHLPRNPDASGFVIAERCYVEQDEPSSYGKHQRTVGCWWGQDRYYHCKASLADAGYITCWQPLPEKPPGGAQ